MTRAQVSQTVRGYRRPEKTDHFLIAIVFAIYGWLIPCCLGWL